MSMKGLVHVPDVLSIPLTASTIFYDSNLKFLTVVVSLSSVRPFVAIQPVLHDTLASLGHIN